MFVFRHALEHYQFTYLFKIDDDTYLRIDKLLQFYRYLKTERVYIGAWRKYDKSALRTTQDLYYAGGQGYILSTDIVEYLSNLYWKYKKPFNSEFGFKIEDAQMGLWLHPIGVRVQYYPMMFECLDDGLIMHKADYTAVYNRLQNSSSMCNTRLLDYERKTPITTEDVEAYHCSITSQ